MDLKQFDTLLPAITATVSRIIAERMGMTPEDALERFVSSDLYTFLEVEDTKVWHLSPLALAMLYEDECAGHLAFPDVIRWPMF